jgi:hypothetical protein
MSFDTRAIAGVHGEFTVRVAAQLSGLPDCSRLRIRHRHSRARGNTFHLPLAFAFFDDAKHRMRDDVRKTAVIRFAQARAFRGRESRFLVSDRGGLALAAVILRAQCV